MGCDAGFIISIPARITMTECHVFQLPTLLKLGSAILILLLRNLEYNAGSILNKQDTLMDEVRISRNTQLEPKIYLLPAGIMIDADDVTLNGNAATIIGVDKTNHGISVSGRKNITLKNLRLLNYYHGISIQNSSDIEISNCAVTGTAETPPNTQFLDIWKPAHDAYGAGIFLHEVTAAKIHDNDLQHQMNGLLTYQCKRLDVTNNLANYCSGFGFHLFGTCDSTFANNYAILLQMLIKKRFLDYSFSRNAPLFNKPSRMT